MGGFYLLLEMKHIEPFFMHERHKGQLANSVSSQVHFLPLPTPSPLIIKDYVVGINSFAWEHPHIFVPLNTEQGP